MTDRRHRFKIGQMVEVMPTTLRAAVTGRYEIIRLVPCDSQDPRYRLKSEDEKYERVLSEGELIPLDTP
ncbi:MAG: hypothetical protein K8F62_08370 [Pseudorhodoplanes sp.]|nr:hypothetical protein [Pseudorhodoplanes sp.]